MRGSCFRGAGRCHRVGDGGWPQVALQTHWWTWQTGTVSHAPPTLRSRESGAVAGYAATVRTPSPLLLLLVACGSLYTSVKKPDGLVCERLKAAGTKLADDLAASRPGDCVVASAGTWVGSFVVPVDVTLAASDGEMVVLKGDGSANPVLTVKGGSRSSVRNVHIDSAGGSGIVIEPGPANLIGVSIAGASKSARTATCTREACLHDNVDMCTHVRR